MLNAAGDATVLARKPKKSNNNKIVIVFCVLVLVLVVGALTLKSSPVSTDACPESNMYHSRYDVTLSAASKLEYDLEFATTPPQQEMGLSARKCMPERSALIFLFPTDDKFGIWMKQMYFSIDVIWLDKDKKIVSIEKNMLPDSYPKIYYPSSDARYVVELNSGQVDKLGVQIGQELSW